MNFSRFLLLSLLAMVLASCHVRKEPMQYFVDIDEMGPLTNVHDPKIKIEPNDELVITVSSKNPAATAIYNLPYVSPVQASNTQRQNTPDQQTYMVDSEGNINFPVLGKIHVQGLTCEQIEHLLTEDISKEVDNPIVTVYLLRYNIVVGGEVNHPSRLSVYVPRFTILDALGQAGDLTQYGRRDNVLIVREENGQIVHARLDLNSAELFTSPYYYLKQNDYIYVEPNNVRQDNAEYNQFNSFRLSAISTIVSGSATIISLIIALSR